MISVGALANHVWQSTVFAGICYLAAYLFSRAEANIRHRIWIAASLKFLVPFSLLISLGSSLVEKTHVETAPTAPASWTAVQRIGAPFAAPPFPSPATPAPEPHRAEFFPTIIVSIWLTGIVVVMFCGIARWRRLAARRGTEALLRDGREMEALERVQARYGWRLGMRLVSTASAVEPGVRGTIRPVLSLPAGICDRLDDRQLDAVITHELCHVRRRDNLISVLHAMVETVFWFHPLVWWIGSRLVYERERACDETVLELGNDASVYAEAILRVCEFYVLTPITTLSRVTGSNLNKRIEEIMTPRRIIRMGTGRKFMLTVAGIGLLMSPVVFGARHPQQLAAPTASTPPPAQTAAPLPLVTAAAAAPTPAPPARRRTRAPAQTPAAAAAPKSAESPYVLGPQDELEISVWREPELTRHVIVRPDGKIGMPLLNDIQAAGLTPMEVREKIQQGLVPFLAEPNVSVIVVAARSLQVTIHGAIAHPGVYQLGRPTTIMEFIAQAGGLSEFAHADQISIVRQEGGATTYHTFDYLRYKQGFSDQNLVLKAGDIVIVP